jgi:hypothetical protein
MTRYSASDLRDWRRSRGWDVPELARQLRRASTEPVAAHDALSTGRAVSGGDRQPHAQGFYSAAGFIDCGVAETDFGAAPRKRLAIH